MISYELLKPAEKKAFKPVNIKCMIEKETEKDFEKG
jgi:hypothetical protein